MFEEITAKGKACIRLDDALINRGICSDLKIPEQETAWLERVAHVCRAANMSGVSVVVESARGPDETVRRIIGSDLLFAAGT